MKDKSIEFTSIYDLFCTAIYPKLNKEFSFKVGNRSDFSKIGKNQFEKLEVEMGLKRKTILAVLQKINELIFIHKDNLS